MASERRFAHSAEEAAYAAMANARNGVHSAEEVVFVSMAIERTSAANARKKGMQNITGIAAISGDTPRPGPGGLSNLLDTTRDN